MQDFTLLALKAAWQPDGMTVPIRQPGAARFFTDTRLAPLWLLLRLWLGYTWLMSGIEKFGDPAWVGADAGKAIHAFFSKAIQDSQGQEATVTGWYAAILQNVAQPAAAC